MSRRKLGAGTLQRVTAGLALGLLVGACASETTVEIPTYSGPGNVRDAAAVQRCVIALADGKDYDTAYEAVRASADAGGETDAYCAALANLQGAVDKLSGLLSLAGNLGAPGLRPAATDLRTLVVGVLEDINAYLEKVYAYSGQILEGEDPAIDVPTLTLALDLSALGFSNIPANLSVDLGGVWDRTEVHLLRALSGAVLGGVDFLLAHSLEVELALPETTADIAKMLATSPDFLKLDEQYGTLAGAKEKLIAVLFALVGDPNGGPGGAGLLATIEAELTDGRDHSNDVIQFIDSDGDGKASKGDKIRIQAIARLADQIGDLDGDGNDDLTPADAELENPLGRNAWIGLVDLGRALRANLESGGDPVHLKPYLSNGTDALWEELQAKDTELEDIQDWLAVDPAAYFANKPSLRNLLMAVETTTITDANNREETLYELALECELGYTVDQWLDPNAQGGLAADSTWRTLCGSDKLSAEGATAVTFKRITFAGADVTHFTGMAFGDDPATAADAAALAQTNATELTAPVVVPYQWAGDLAPVEPSQLPVVADGFAPVSDPTAHNDGLLYVVMQDPSFAGTLYLDLTGTGDNMAQGTQASLNMAIQMIWTTFGDNLMAAIDGATDSGSQ